MMSWKQIHQICYVYGTRSWGLHTLLSPHTASGECDADHYDDDGGHQATIDHRVYPRV